MDEEETRNCPNCKREIPAVNFTIHSVHCARNIRMCPVCKEPVPSAELDEHHQKFHKLLPCKQCGESVCGTDLEDHIRDSCANTIKTCRYCELALPRRELPPHEAYCGVRTEQCPDCREWVMIKYRQLHLDSNHGFIRLDDDPAPDRMARPGRPFMIPSGFTPGPGFARGNFAGNWPNVAGFSEPMNLDDSAPRPAPAPPAAARPTSIFDDAGPSNFHNDFPRTQVRYLGSSNSSSATSSNPSPQDAAGAGARPLSNGVKKRTNDQPQINTNMEVANKVDKDLPISRGAVKKRPAPRPPRAEARRDLPYYSAMERQQREERHRREQNEYNLAHGLPPVLSAAAKIEKLRKMDALQNRDAEEPRRRRPAPAPEPARRADGRRLDEFKDLKPMSPEQFLARFSSLQVGGGGGDAAAGAGAEPGLGLGPDRFQEIKSSLQELRRGLNEVTAPYNNNNVNMNNNNERSREERLPCEFCGALLPPDDLVQHQTGCRPDLAQYWGAPAPSPGPAPPPRAPSPARPDPVIPCEFCAQSLPVYLITEHQEQCAREVDILSAD